MTKIKKLLNFILNHDFILDFLLLFIGFICFILVNSLEFDSYFDNVFSFTIVYFFLLGFCTNANLYVFIDFFKSIKHHIIKKDI